MGQDRGRCWGGGGGSQYGEVQCIMGNGHVGPHRGDRQT